MLSVKGLTKKYDKVTAVNDISFDVNSGEVAVLLGPNGAGKSTTMKSIIGVLRYDGEITICGDDNKCTEAKKHYGYVPETPALYDMLTVDEHLQFIAKAYELEDWEDKSERLLERFDLIDKRDKLGKELSKGMRQKVSICCTLTLEPDVILFDEPMIGLDPKAIKELKQVFVELKEKGKSVLISTHIIDSISEIWDKALIMNKGEIVMSKTRDELDNGDDALEELFFSVTGE